MSVTVRPALIAMLSAFGERGIRGRTVLQKNAYFLGVLTENDFELQASLLRPIFICG